MGIRTNKIDKEFEEEIIEKDLKVMLIAEKFLMREWVCSYEGI